MGDELRVWTTVGSAGTLNQTDLAKVSFSQSTVQLGSDLTNAPARSVRRAGPELTNLHAVVRYNVTPVDGLFPTVDGLFPTKPHFDYQLKIRFRNQITAKLMEVDLDTGDEQQLILFDSSTPNFAATSGFQVGTALPAKDSTVLDFVKKAYYVEATLTAPFAPVGRPAAISIIKVAVVLPIQRGR